MSEIASAYSRAFENMVHNGPDDVVGLLAYALYKQHIREEAAQGQVTEAGRRNPTSRMVATFRASADNLLGKFAEEAIRLSEFDREKSATLQRLDAVESNVKAHVTDAQPSFLAQIAMSIIGWLASLAVTIVIVAGLRSSEVLSQVTAKIVAFLTGL
ncbi:hypothetical protein NDN16_09280 [Aureimonas altamirensis]|uniref:hypothetical protein n=1 Tax=Aureimonas altamirensis TaxID=370622 RepID=UPI002036EF58|nr:hypothetical protein [Aureimonas altamirensis]MCM2503864.1 hypothetical protein [Aureimonas altamirensis]